MFEETKSVCPIHDRREGGRLSKVRYTAVLGKSARTVLPRHSPLHSTQLSHVTKSCKFYTTPRLNTCTARICTRILATATDDNSGDYYTSWRKIAQSPTLAPSYQSTWTARTRRRRRRPRDGSSADVQQTQRLQPKEMRKQMEAAQSRTAEQYKVQITLIQLDITMES